MGKRLVGVLAGLGMGMIHAALLLALVAAVLLWQATARIERLAAGIDARIEARLASAGLSDRLDALAARIADGPPVPAPTPPGAIPPRPDAGPAASAELAAALAGLQAELAALRADLAAPAPRAQLLARALLDEVAARLAGTPAPR